MDPSIPQNKQEQATGGKSQLQLEAIVEESLDAIIGESLDGLILSWNGGARKMFGYSKEEAIGKPVTFLLPPEIHSEVPTLLGKVKNGEFIADYDSVRIRKDGSSIGVSLSVSPIHSVSGEIIGASVVERDITKRKKAEEVLRQIQLIVENSYDAIIGTTLDGVITSWNGGAQKMFGYSAEEVIGKSGSLLFPPEIWAKVPALLNKIKAKEVVADYDTGGLRKDGKEFNMAISISPIIAEDGTVTGASVVERDITARKKAEEVLRQIKLIVENSRDAIIGTTMDGVITSWNDGAQKMFGYLAEETIGKAFTFLLPSELRNELSTLLGKVSQGEFVADYDSVRIRKDGSKINVALSVSPIYSEDNAIIGASIVERDITERKKSEQHIKELNEVRNKFIEIISHQLRTPLTAINWNLDMLLKGEFGKMDATQEKFLHVTHAASLNITNRIYNLLTAMDIEEGRALFKKEEMALDSICAAVVNEMRKLAEIKDISLTYIPPETAFPTMEGDSEKIRMVIANFIENAIGYTKEGGKIIAKLLMKGPVARFEVTDTGVGIPKPEQHRVSERFFRASNASVMQTDAFGLGLFIAKNFIQQYKGKIGFESIEDKGSTFWFEIPTKSN